MGKALKKSGEFQYLLVASWEENRGEWRNRVIHSTAREPFDPKAIIHNYISQSHPDWLPQNCGTIGYVDGKHRMSRISVFRIEWSDIEDTAFHEWIQGAASARKEFDKKRERQRDLKKFLELREKWGFTILDEIEEATR
jgi:hypothetical protein